MGKLLADLSSMQEESLATAALEQEAAAAREARAAARGAASGPFATAAAMSAGSFDESGCDAYDMEFGRMSIEVSAAFNLAWLAQPVQAMLCPSLLWAQ